MAASAPARTAPTAPSPRPLRALPAARGYLDTSTCGLPLPETVAALEEHVRAWSAGNGSLELFHEPVQRSRRLFAAMAGVPEQWVAVGSQVSVAVGFVAAGLAARSRVVLADNDFTSLLWPFLARADLRCSLVPLDALADAVAAGCDWVAVSSVQSCDGVLADLDAVRAAADATGARVLVDATQSAGWLPLDASRWDVTVTGAYKWLLSPRGTAFTTARPEALEELAPTSAGWFAGEDVETSYYGGPLRLAGDARRLDVSAAWPSWAGTAPALQALLDVGVDAVHRHDVGLANLFRERLGLPPSDSAVVSLDADVDALRAAGARCSGRDGRARLAFHLYNDEDDVDLAARALGR
jgi:selenocysteine lyase/cysteine desulfurase